MREAHQVVTELIIDAHGSVSGAAEHVRASRSAEQASQRLADAEHRAKLKQDEFAASFTGVSASLKRVTTDFQRLQATTDPIFAKQVQHRQALERAVLTADAAVRRGVATEQQAAAAVSRLRAQQIRELNAVKTATQNLHQVQRAYANDNTMHGMNIANIAAQFQDIGVTLAMGMSPIQIALQQGTQLQAVLGPMGAAGAVKALGAAFVSLINPVSLVTLGLVGLTAAAIQYFSSSEEESKALDNVLKAHAENIADIKARWGSAADGVVEYVAKSKDLIEAESILTGVKLQEQLDEFARGLVEGGDLIRTQAREMQAELEGLQQAFVLEQDPMRLQEMYVEIERLSHALQNASSEALVAGDRFGPFKAEIDAFAETVRAGTPDFIALQDAVSRGLKADPSNAELQRLAETIYDLVAIGSTLQRRLEANAGAVDQVGRAAAGNIGAVMGFSEALRQLGSMIPNIAKAQQAQQQLLEANSAYTQGVADLDARLREGRISVDQYVTSKQHFSDSLSEAQREITGLASATRDLEKAERSAYIDTLSDREAAAARIRDNGAEMIKQLQEAGAAESEIERAAAIMNQQLELSAKRFDEMAEKAGARGAARSIKEAEKAARDAAREFEAFNRFAGGLMAKYFPAEAARERADELLLGLTKFRDELDDLRIAAVEQEIISLYETGDKAFKDMAKSVEQTLGQALGDLFTKPMEDLDDFLDDVMRGFARMASQNIAGMFDGLFSGGAPDAANDNARQTKLLAKELGKATAVGSAEGTRSGFLSALGNLGGGGAQGGGGMRGGLLAGLGGAGVGYSTQSPVMGALGGAVSGFASGGIFGAVVGGIGGLLGGIFGKSQAEKDQARAESLEAKRRFEANRALINEIIDQGMGHAVGEVRAAFNDFEDQATELRILAGKASKFSKRDELFAAIDKYEKVLKKDFARGFGGTIRALEAGFGPNSPFVQARSSVASLGEEMRKFVDDTDWATNGTKKLNKARNAAQEFLLSQFSGPDSMSPMEAEMERLKGVKAGLKQALKDLGMTGKEAGKAIRDAMKDAKSALRADYTAGLTASVREISGQGYLNEMLAVDERFDERLRDIKALKLGSGATRLAVDELTMSLADIALTSGLTSKELMTFGASLGLSKSHLKDAVKDMAALSKAREQEAARISAQQAAAEKAAAKAAELDRFRDLSLSLTRITTDTSTLSGALKVLNAERALEIRRARDAGESARNITLMERALAAERQQIVNQFNRAKIDDAKSAFDEAFAAFTSFADGIRDFRNSLKLDTNYSTLSASEKLAEARSQFEDLASRAMKGDRQAMEQLTGSAQTYLDQARSYYSSTQGYADIYDAVMGALRQAETSARGQITEAEKQLAANQKLVSGLDTVSTNLVSLTKATTDLTAAVQAYRSAGGSYSGFSTGGYTGDMPIGRVAGVVHGQEFVAHAAATARWRPQLEAMNAGTYRPADAAGGNDRENFRELGKAFIGASDASTTAIVGAINEMSARVARLEAATKQAAHEQAKISRKAG